MTDSVESERQAGDLIPAFKLFAKDVYGVGAIPKGGFDTKQFDGESPNTESDIGDPLIDDMDFFDRFLID